MSGTVRLLEESISVALERYCTPERLVGNHGGWDPDLWASLEQAGLTLISVPETVGGSGGELSHAAVIVRAVGRYTAAVPVADSSLVAGWLLAQSNVEVPSGPLAVALFHRADVLTNTRSGRPPTVSGTCTAVPWAAVADHLVVSWPGPRDRAYVALLPGEACTVRPTTNVAGEPHATVAFQHSAVLELVEVDGKCVDLALSRAALSRALLLEGAMSQALQSSLNYSLERHQFGRPIGRFQAIQRLVALIAEEVASSAAINDLAIERLAGDDVAACWAAKCRAGQAAGVVAAAAHQIHGALGFTDEHPLQRATRRLWAWRDEFGTESFWAARLGSAIAANDEGVWPFLTSRL